MVPARLARTKSCLRIAWQTSSRWPRSRLTNSLAGVFGAVAGDAGGSDRQRPCEAASGWLGMAVCLIPIAACLLLTKSRSGYAAACVGIAGWLWLLWQRQGDEFRIGWKLPAAALAGVAVLLISAALAVEGPSVLGRASKSFGYRLQYWQSSLRMIADHPWFGCGPGNFQAAYTQYKLPEASEEIADPHNFLLEIWATAGIPAALAFLAVLGCFASRGQGSGARVSEELEIGQVGGEPPALVSDQQSTIPNRQSTIPPPTAGCMFSAAAVRDSCCRCPWRCSTRHRRA